MSKRKPVVFQKSITGALSIIVLAVPLLLKGLKSKTDLYKSTGHITLLSNHFEEWPNRDFGKYRYLQIDSSPEIFELFIGHGFGDFEPAFEKMDSLKTGDKVDLYYNVNDKEQDHRLNRELVYIDKGQQSFFVLGNKNKIGGLIFLSFGIVFGLTMIVLKVKGKIE